MTEQQAYQVLDLLNHCAISLRHIEGIGIFIAVVFTIVGGFIIANGSLGRR